MANLNRDDKFCLYYAALSIVLVICMIATILLIFRSE